jgi:hypothetical protein
MLATPQGSPNRSKELIWVRTIRTVRMAASWLTCSRAVILLPAKLCRDCVRHVDTSDPSTLLCYYERARDRGAEASSPDMIRNGAWGVAAFRQAAVTRPLLARCRGPREKLQYGGSRRAPPQYRSTLLDWTRRSLGPRRGSG